MELCESKVLRVFTHGSYCCIDICIDLKVPRICETSLLHIIVNHFASIPSKGD